MLRHEPLSADLSDFASIGQLKVSCWIERKDNLPQSTSLPFCDLWIRTVCLSVGLNRQSAPRKQRFRYKENG